MRRRRGPPVRHLPHVARVGRFRSPERVAGVTDGAPCWVYEKLGIDYSALAEADAAIVMQYHYDFSDPRKVQEDRYPTMCWSQNYRYAGNAVPWTLFFAGRTFTPDFLIDGVNVQDYLQARRRSKPDATGC